MASRYSTRTRSLLLGSKRSSRGFAWHDDASHCTLHGELSNNEHNEHLYAECSQGFVFHGIVQYKYVLGPMRVRVRGILHNTYSMYEYSTSTLSPTTVHVRPASSPIQTDLLEVSQRILCCIHFQRFRKVTRRQLCQHVSEGFTKSTFHAMQVHADIKESGWDWLWVFVGVSRMGRDGVGGSREEGEVIRRGIGTGRIPRIMYLNYCSLSASYFEYRLIALGPPQMVLALPAQGMLH